MIHEEYNLMIFRTLFSHYLEKCQFEGTARFKKMGGKEIGMDWIIFFEVTLIYPDEPDFVFHVQLYRNGADPSKPRLQITYMVKWYDNLLGSAGKENYLLEILDALFGVNITLQKDGSFLFEHEFGILEDGHYSRRLFSYETTDAFPIDLLLGNDEIVDPFLEETEFFFDEIKGKFSDTLVALHFFLEEHQAYLYESILQVVEGIQFLNEDEFELAKKERDYAKSILKEIDTLDSDSDPDYELKIREAIRKIEENVTTKIKRNYLLALQYKLK